MNIHFCSAAGGPLLRVYRALECTGLSMSNSKLKKRSLSKQIKEAAKSVAVEP